MQGDEIGILDEILLAYELDKGKLGIFLNVLGIDIKAYDLAAHGMYALGKGSADAAQADDADGEAGHTGDGSALGIIPDPVFNLGIGSANLAGYGHHQCQCLIGNLKGTVIGNVANGNVVTGGSFQINIVDAYAVTADKLKIRQSCKNLLGEAGILVTAGNRTLEVLDQFVFSSALAEFPGDARFFKNSLFLVKISVIAIGNNNLGVGHISPHNIKQKKCVKRKKYDVTYCIKFCTQSCELAH